MCPRGLGRQGADGLTGVDGLEKKGLPVRNTFLNQLLIRPDGLDGLKMHIGGLRASPPLPRAVHEAQRARTHNLLLSRIFARQPVKGGNILITNMFSDGRFIPSAPCNAPSAPEGDRSWALTLTPTILSTALGGTVW